MNDDKRSAMKYSPFAAPAQTLLGFPRRVRDVVQTKAKLSVWEGEGGATATPATVVKATVS